MEGDGSGKVYLLYTCENVDKCEQPLRYPNFKYILSCLICVLRFLDLILFESFSHTAFLAGITLLPPITRAPHHHNSINQYIFKVQSKRTSKNTKHICGLSSESVRNKHIVSRNAVSGIKQCLIRETCFHRNM